MAINLLTQITDAFRGDATESVASALGETPVRTQSALAAAIPALIGTLAMKTATTDQAGSLLDVMARNKLDTGTFADASGAVKAPGGINNLIEAGRPLLESFFGGPSTAMSDRVASYSGVSRSSSSKLLNLALPIVLGYIARYLRSTEWNAANLMKLLGDQKEFLKDAPAGLTQTLGEEEATTRHTYASEPARDEHVEAYSAAPTRSSWMWVVPLLLLIPLLGYFMTRDREPRQEAAVRTMPAPQEQARRVEPGLESPVGTSSVPSAPARFGPYRLEFNAGSDALTAESAAGLRRIADELKAHPQVKIEIAGYTDNSGSEAANLRLSRERAMAVRDRIATMGIDRSRMTAEGFGGRQADKDTAEGREHNRVEIRVTPQ